MNVSALVNETQPEAKLSHASPPQSATSRDSAPHVSPSPPVVNGHQTLGTVPQARPTPGQQTPLYAPSSISQSQNQNRGLTPLHTPHGGAPGGGQYPFPTQHVTGHSPVTAHPASHQYRNHEPYTATTPGTRPSSHGYSTQPSPGQGSGLGPYQPALNTHQTRSLSPTPSSQHSQTPHSMRQSPMSAMNHPYAQQQYHPSQPSTPLGPPQIPQRYSNQHKEPSPQHHRTFSGASNGIVSASPAHHQSTSATLIGSPSAYHRPSPVRRQTSDYRGSMERERSESVSPKTMVPPRPQSMSSRHSSQQDVHSARSSLQPSASVASIQEAPGHVQYYAQTHSGSQPASEVSQGYPRTSGGQPASGNSLSPKESRVPLQHHSQKMGMSHLLTPTEHTQQSNGLGNRSHLHLPAKASDRVHSPSAQVNVATSEAYAQATRQQTYIKTEALAAPGDSESSPHSNGADTKPLDQTPPDAMDPRTTATRSHLKRSADSELATEPVAKRGRKRKYLERPIWATLHPNNPRFGQPGVTPNSCATSAKPHNQPQNHAQQSAHNGMGQNPQKHVQQGTDHPNGLVAAEKPWLQNPPLDGELIHARQCLGAWEKSFLWHVPIAPLNRAVMDWLYFNLSNNSDIGNDPRDGTIEIEVKIGTLIDQRSGERYSLPVESATVVNLNGNQHINFASEMNEVEHKSMNQFLNEAVQRSVANKGRSPIEYKHIRETDSFKLLSKLGLQSLPPAARNRTLRKDLSMRTSRRDKDGAITARIIKIPIGEHLHIYGAQDPYDVRISMNLEINMDRPDLDIDALTHEPPDMRPKPNRKKDRLSYRHLNAYSVDLTRVDVAGLAPKYELELEVDAQLLRKHIALNDSHQDNAYQDIVEGFVANMLYLMRVRKQEARA